MPLELPFPFFLNNSVLWPFIGAEQGSAAETEEATMAHSRVSVLKQSEEGGPIREVMTADMGDIKGTDQINK